MTSRPLLASRMSSMEVDDKGGGGVEGKRGGVGRRVEGLQRWRLIGSLSSSANSAPAAESRRPSLYRTPLIAVVHIPIHF